MINMIVTFILVFTAVAPAYSGTVDQLVEKGDSHREKFDNLDAARSYEEAYGMENDNFEILKKVVISYNDAGEDHRDRDREKAEKFFSKAIQYAEMSSDKFPEKEDNHFLLALTYGNMARFSDGKRKVELARNVESNIKKMIELRPDFAPSYVVLGVYYREISELGWLLEKFADTLMGGLPGGTIEDSVRTLEKAVSLEPDAIYTQFELAKTYESVEEYEKASIHYKKVLELPVTDHHDDLKKEKSEKALARIKGELKR